MTDTQRQGQVPAGLPLIAKVIALAPVAGGIGQLGLNALADRGRQAQHEGGKTVELVGGGASAQRRRPAYEIETAARSLTAGELGLAVVHVLARNVQAETQAVRAAIPVGIGVVLELIVPPEERIRGAWGAVTLVT